MNWFSKPDPKEQMRENNRNLRKTQRGLDSDKVQIERREKELENEIKKLAKGGHREACAKLAKQLIQLRNQKAKLVGMNSHITGISVQNNHMYSMGKMSEAMGQTTATMKVMNKQNPIADLSKNMREFQMAQEQMGMSEEMMNDAMDSMFDEPGDEEEQNAIVNKVLDEIGIDTNSKLSTIPKVPTSLGTSKTQVTDGDIEKMLASLRG